MKNSQKIALSLLISVILFSTFTFFAFSGLFDYIETAFYNQKLTRSINQEISLILSAVQRFHAENMSRFQPLLKDEYIGSAYQTNQSQEDIFRRENAFAKLKEDFPDLVWVRFLDAEGRKIHYSTNPGDIRSRDQFRISYFTFEETDSDIPAADLLVPEGGEPAVSVSDASQAYIYRFPVRDAYGIHRGTALFYVNAGALKKELVSRSLISIGAAFTFLGKGDILFYEPMLADDVLLEQARSVWSDERPPAFPLVENAAGERYYLFSGSLEGTGSAGILVPESRFTLSKGLQYLLLASVFVTVFLLVFFLLNTRQEPEVVLSERIKRFQINLMREYLEGKHELDWNQWYGELEQRRGEIKQRIRKGIGRVKGERSRELDEYIDKSWDEILSILGSRIRSDAPRSGEIERLEEVLLKVLSNRNMLPVLENAVSADPGVNSRGMPKPASGRPETGGSAEPPETSPLSGSDSTAAEDVEELVEELEGNLEELDGNVEELDGNIEELEAEDVEELSELEELEEIEEAEPADADLEDIPEVPAALGDKKDDRAVPVLEIREAVSVSGSRGVNRGSSGGNGGSGEKSDPGEMHDVPSDLEALDDIELLATIPVAGVPAYAALRGPEPEEQGGAENSGFPSGSGNGSGNGNGHAAGNGSGGSAPGSGPVRSGYDPSAREGTGGIDEDPDDPLELDPYEEPEEPAELESFEEPEIPETSISGEAEADSNARPVETESNGDVDEVEELESLEEEEEDFEGEALMERARELLTEEEVEELENLEEDVEDLEVVEDEELEELEEVFELEEIEDVGFSMISSSASRQSHAPAPKPSEQKTPPAGKSAPPVQPPVQPREEEAAVENAAPSSVSLSEMEKKGLLLSVSIEGLTSLLAGEEESEVILFEDGVYRINEQVARKGGEKKNQDVQDLIDAVIQEPFKYQERYVPVMVLGSDGIDYDKYMLDFRNNEAGIVKSMLRLSGRCGSTMGGILVKTGGGFTFRHAIGMSGEDIRKFVVPEEHEFAKKYLLNRQAVYLRAPCTTIREFASFCPRLDASRTDNGLIFLPIRFQEKPAYFVMSTKTEAETMDAVLHDIRSWKVKSWV